MRSLLFVAAAALTALTASPASAAVEDGLEVAVQVLDTEGKPIPSAVVRHPEEKERHRVNVEDGTWRGTAVYLEDGSELLFTKDMELVFEVSAPGYKNARAAYVVKKRKNFTAVTLEKMEIALDPEEDSEDGGPAIGFKHDQPRD